jgi:hypothetical protein
MARRTRKNNKKRTRKNSIRKRNIKKIYRQKGGTIFNQAQREQLIELGFTEQQITPLQARLGNIPSNNAMNLIQQSLQQINPQTHLPNTPQEIIDSLEDVEGSTDSESDSDEENDEQPQENGLNDAFIEEDGVEGNQYNNNNNDLMLEDLMGGKRGKRGKRRKTRKTRNLKKIKKSRKSRKMNGGALYGTGVGANNYDPNYSIHNTRELTLFPYKPLNN